MGRARRRAKSDMLTTNSCEGCRKVQKETCLPPSQKCHRNSSSEIYQKSLIDYESETDSAIDTASIISSSDSRSITSSSESTSSLELSLSDDTLFIPPSLIPKDLPRNLKLLLFQLRNWKSRKPSWTCRLLPCM
ncbi:hypothetical protein EB796_011438 [Bugula neritina]|uniref:Uncharacterized protein n=1 Tax=Bugula neritina TaxID=10212 RepID=A0A7J7JX07_BUGNE|nr:hypothetical protein EB796_011438 [Bugula neritina]